MKPTITDRGVNFNHKPHFAGMTDIFDSGIALRSAFQNHSPLEGRSFLLGKTDVEAERFVEG